MGNWVSECIDMVKAKTGTPPNGRRWAGELGIIKREGFEPEQIKRHLREYLYRTPIVYIGATRFRETFKYWDPGIRDRTDIDKQLDREQKQRVADNLRGKRDDGLARLNVETPNHD